MFHSKTFQTECWNTKVHYYNIKLSKKSKYDARKVSASSNHHKYTIALCLLLPLLTISTLIVNLISVKIRVCRTDWKNEPKMSEEATKLSTYFSKER